MRGLTCEEFEDDEKNMVNMRNKIIDEYFGVDISIVRETIRDDVPSLKKQFGMITRDLK